MVIGLSDEGDVEWLRGARNIRDAQGLQKEVPAAIPIVLIVQAVNNATSEGGRWLPATPTRAQRSDALRKGAGVLVVADAADHLCQVRPYKIAGAPSEAMPGERRRAVVGVGGRGERRGVGVGKLGQQPMAVIADPQGEVAMGPILRPIAVLDPEERQPTQRGDADAHRRRRG